MIKILGIDHIVIRSKNPTAMIDFYTDVLGCTVEREMAAEIGLTQLRAGNALIDIVSVEGMLGRRGGPAPTGAGNNMDHFCLQIESFEEKALLEYLRAKGITVNDFERRYGAKGFGRSVYIQDPEKNIVELKGNEYETGLVGE